MVVIGNPIAGGGAGEKISQALSILKKKGIDAELMLTSGKGDAELFARQAATMSDTIVIAAGGDGTYNEAANGLAHTNTPLAILPMGTTSVLARELGIPINIEKALDIAVGGTAVQAHLGKISCRGQKTTSASHPTTSSEEFARYFLLMTGIGYDGESVYEVNEQLKKYSGKLAYIVSGIGALIKYHPGLLSIKAAIRDNDDITGERFHVNTRHCSLNKNLLEAAGYTIVVSKAACYGGDMKITPEASLTSPHLYIFISHKRGRINLLHYLGAIISGRATELQDTTYFRADSIEIEGDSHIQIDGDYAGKTPARITVAENALKLIVPNDK